MWNPFKSKEPEPIIANAGTIAEHEALVDAQQRKRFEGYNPLNERSEDALRHIKRGGGAPENVWDAVVDCGVKTPMAMFSIVVVAMLLLVVVKDLLDDDSDVLGFKRRSRRSFNQKKRKRK